MQNQRHVGGQSTIQSMKMTQCSGKSLAKRVQPQSNDSNEMIGEQQNCKVTSQNNATNSLDVLDPNLGRCAHANLYDELSKDYLEVYFYLQCLRYSFEKDLNLLVDYLVFFTFHQ